MFGELQIIFLNVCTFIPPKKCHILKISLPWIVLYLNVNVRQSFCVSHWTNILIANVILVRQSLSNMGDVYEMTFITVCWMTVRMWSFIFIFLHPLIIVLIILRVETISATPVPYGAVLYPCNNYKCCESCDVKFMWRLSQRGLW